MSGAATKDRLYLWCAVGSPDNPPGRVRVESCADCAAWVPVERFDGHGRWHARSARSVRE